MPKSRDSCAVLLVGTCCVDFGRLRVSGCPAVRRRLSFVLIELGPRSTRRAACLDAGHDAGPFAD